MQILIIAKYLLSFFIEWKCNYFPPHTHTHTQFIKLLFVDQVVVLFSILFFCCCCICLQFSLTFPLLYSICYIWLIIFTNVWLNVGNQGYEKHLEHILANRWFLKLSEHFQTSNSYSILQNQNYLILILNYDTRKKYLIFFFKLLFSTIFVLQLKCRTNLFILIF